MQPTTRKRRKRRYERKPHPASQLFAGVSKDDMMVTSVKLPTPIADALEAYALELQIAMQTSRRISKALTAGWLITRTLEQHPPVFPNLVPPNDSEGWGWMHNRYGSVTVMIEIPARRWAFSDAHRSVAPGEPLPLATQAEMQGPISIEHFVTGLLEFGLQNTTPTPVPEALLDATAIHGTEALRRLEVEVPSSHAALLPQARVLFPVGGGNGAPAQLPDDSALLGLLIAEGAAADHIPDDTGPTVSRTAVLPEAVASGTAGAATPRRLGAYVAAGIEILRTKDSRA